MIPLAKIKSYIYKRRTKFIVAVIVAVATMGWLWVSRGEPFRPVSSFSMCADQGYIVTESNPPTCRANGKTFTGPVASYGPLPPEAVNQSFLLLVRGDLKSSYPRRQQVINDQVEWQRYWREVHSDVATLPPIIPVDFTNNTVIGLTEGTQPTTGYLIRVTSILTSAAGSVVYITNQAPTISCQVEQKPINRYQIVKTTKLVEPVSFRITTENRKC